MTLAASPEQAARTASETPANTGRKRMPTAVRVALVLAGFTLAVDLLLLLVGSPVVPSRTEDFLFWAVLQLLWVAGLILVAGRVKGAQYVLAGLAAYEVLMLIVAFAMHYSADLQLGALTPLRVTALAFLFTPSARRWIARREPTAEDVEDGPAYWGLLWVLPLFALEWWFIPEVHNEWAQALLWGAAGMVTYIGYVRWQERRRPFELCGGSHALGQAAAGVLLGLTFPASIVAFYLMSGLALFIGVKTWHTFSLTLGAIAVSVAIPVFEELAFRGVILRYIELGLGSWPALALSAFLFAGYHSVGQYQTGFEFGSRLLVGLMLGAAYLITRRLWLSIGVHIGLNLGITAVFGTSDTIPLLTFVQQGDPYLLTGEGAWIPYTSMLALFALVFVLVAWRWGKTGGPRVAWSLQQGRDPAPSADAPAGIAAEHRVVPQPTIPGS